MGKDRNAHEVEYALRQYGWTTRSEKSKRIRDSYTSGEIEGEPDVLAILRGQGVFIEIKTFRQSFGIRNYRDEQVAWADEAVKHKEHVWVWFFGGDDPTNYNREKKNADGDFYRPRSAWLIPYPLVKKTFDMFEGLQKSIPYGILKRMNPTIREKNLTFVGMFDNYELIVDKGPTWHLYEEHPFAEQYMKWHRDLRTKYPMRFATGDIVGIQGYMGEYEILDRSHYNIEDGCWMYEVEDVVSGLNIDHVPEKIMYLKEKA